MIRSAQPLPVGNAVLLSLGLPASADWLRVLRKTTGTFTGATDADAAVVYEGADPNTVDYGTFGAKAYGTLNGIQYFYQAFAWDGAAFTASGGVVSATPAATYSAGGPDVRQLFRDRLDAGLSQEITRGLLAIKPPAGAARATIEVLNAPPEFEKVKWPVVSVHLQTDSSENREVGEELGDDKEGWLSPYTLSVVAWSQNPDERYRLDRAIRRILLANMAVFSSAGVAEIDIRGQAIDEFERYPAAVYQAVFTITCKAPFYIEVAETGDVIESVTVEPEVQIVEP